MLRTAAVVRARHHVETGQSAEADVAEAQASVAATVPRAARLWTLGLPCAVCTAPAWSGVRVGVRVGVGVRLGVGVGVGVGVGLGLGLGLGPRSCSTPSACPWCSTHAGHMQGTCRAHAHAHAHAHAVYAEHLPRDGEPGAAVTRLDGHGEQRARGAARGLVRVRARVRVGYGVRG